MQVNVCLGAILIPKYLDSILAILLPGAEKPECIPKRTRPKLSFQNTALVIKVCEGRRPHGNGEL